MLYVHDACLLYAYKACIITHLNDVSYFLPPFLIFSFTTLYYRLLRTIVHKQMRLNILTSTVLLLASTAQTTECKILHLFPPSSSFRADKGSAAKNHLLVLA